MPFPSPMPRGKGSLSCALRAGAPGHWRGNGGGRKNLGFFLATTSPGGDDHRVWKWEILKAARGYWFHVLGPGRLCTMVDFCGLLLTPCSLGQPQPFSTLLLSSR